MQYDEQNVFARIIRGEIQCNKVYEDAVLLVFHDAHPVAPVHVLVVPKDPYISFDHFAKKSSPHMVAHFFQTIQHVAELLGVNETGYRIISNSGKDAMQTVGHFHVHIIAKKKLGGLIGEDAIDE